MNGFTATPHSTIVDQVLQVEAGEALVLEGADIDCVAADGWWPDVVLADLRSSMRIGSVVTAVRLREAVRNAIYSTRRELADWKTARVAEGRLNLAAVPADTIDGASELVMLWRRAVAAFAAADLAETHRDITASKDGVARAEERSVTADEHRRNATHAVRDLLGQTRTAVELI